MVTGIFLLVGVFEKNDKIFPFLAYIKFSTLKPTSEVLGNNRIALQCFALEKSVLKIGMKLSQLTAYEIWRDSIAHARVYRTERFIRLNKANITVRKYR